MSLETNNTTTNSDKAKPKAPSAPTVAKRLEEIEAIVARFQNVLNDETTALKKNDVEAFRKLSDEKIELAREYQRMIEHVSKRKTSKLKMTDEEQSQLEKISGAFKETLRKNADALENSRAAVERLVKRITSVACESVNSEKQTYTAYGKLQNQSSRPVSTLIDQA